MCSAKCCLRLLFHMLNRKLKGSGVEKCIRIEQDHIAAPSRLDGNIIRRTETKVDCTTNNSEIRKLSLHHFRGAVAGVIVHNKCFNPQSIRLTLHELEAFAQQLSGVERYDYDGGIYGLFSAGSKGGSQFSGEDTQL